MILNNLFGKWKSRRSAFSKGDQVDTKKKKYSKEERMNILIHKVLEFVREAADTKLPQKGKFTKFGIGLCFPDDEEFRGVLNIEHGTDPQKRVAYAGVYRIGTDRLVSNCFFFDSTQAVQDWLEAGETVPMLIETYYHLRELADD